MGSETESNESVNSLRRPIQLIRNNLEALRDFVDVLDTLLLEQRTELLTKNKSFLVPLLAGLSQASILEPALKLPVGVNETLTKLGANPNDVAVTKTGNTVNIELKVPAKSIRDSDKTLKEILRGSTRTRLLYSSALMNLTTSVELFFARLLHEYFARHPEAIGHKEKVFSLEDLSAFDTVKEAREHYVLSRIEDLLRGSLSEWFDFARSRLKLSMGYLKPDLEILEETFQRRNIIVHNGGRANSIYLAKVAPTARAAVKVGDNLTPDRAYLNERIDLWERACILIAAELWKQLDPSDVDRCDSLNDAIYAHMLAQRWGLASSLAQFVVRDKQMPEACVATAQLNYWQCLKWSGRWTEISAEVQSADFSAKSLRYQVGRLALLGAPDDFFPLAERALEGNELTRSDFAEWPIFRDMRDDPRFAGLVPAQRKSRRKMKPSSDGQDA